MTDSPVTLTVRTHPKVLFKPLIAQLVLLIAHVAVNHYWHYADEVLRGYGDSEIVTGIADWAPVAVHALIIMFELHLAIIPFLRWRAQRFTLTPNDVQIQWGVLYKHTQQIPLQSITHVSTERGILDRIFGAGTIVFWNAAATDQQAQRHVLARKNGGNSNNGVRFHDVPRAEAVKRQVEANKNALHDRA